MGTCAGLLFVASTASSSGADLRSDTADVPQLIRSVTADNARAQRRISELQADVNELSDASAARDGAVAELTARGDALAAAAGRTPVSGPGVTVTLTDAVTGGVVPAGKDPNDYVIHQQDVQAVVNALWAGGAEAMQLQDQRVISTSAVRCVGNTLILQGRVYSPPFVISAIGEQEALQESLNADAGVTVLRQWATAVGLGYDVAVADTLSMPAYEGSIDPQPGVSAGATPKEAR